METILFSLLLGLLPLLFLIGTPGKIRFYGTGFILFVTIFTVMWFGKFYESKVPYYEIILFIIFFPLLWTSTIMFICGNKLIKGIWGNLGIIVGFGLFWYVVLPFILF